MSRPVIIALIATLAALVAAQTPTCPTCPKKNILTVTGVGERSTPSTIAVVSLSIEREGRTAVEVQQALAGGVTSLLEYLRAANVSEIETTGVSLSARRNFSAPSRPIIGYSGENSITFETTIDESGPILDGSVNAGASQISRVSFKSTNEATIAARRQAIADAVTRATEEAQAAVAASGKSLEGPTRIAISDRFRPQATPSFAGGGGGAGFARSAAVSTELVGQDVDISATVSMTFEFS